MKKQRILIADDDYIFCELTKYILTENNYEVIISNNYRSTVEFLKEDTCDLVLLDLHFPDLQTGINTLQSIKNITVNLPVILITSDNLTLMNRFSDFINYGAYDIIEKPIHEDRLILTLKNTLKYFELSRKKESYYESEIIYLIGNSSVMKKTRNKIDNDFNNDNNLIIYANEGTGIDNIINVIHKNSSRKEEKLFIIDCSKQNNKDLEIELFGDPQEQNFEKKFKNLKIVKAEKSILVIKNLHFLPVKSQEKLVRALLGRKLKSLGGRSLDNLKTKIIFTTLRENYHTLYSGNICNLISNICPNELIIPSLEERIEDIPLIIEHLLLKYNQTTDSNIILKEDALQALMSHKWNENITELKRVILRILQQIESEEITLKDIIFEEESYNYFIPLTFKESMNNYEKRYLEQILKYHSWDLTESANTLKIDRSNLFKKLQKNGIKLKKK